MLPPFDTSAGRDGWRKRPQPCSRWQRSAWLSQLSHPLIAAVVGAVTVVVDMEAAWAEAEFMAVDLVVVGFHGGGGGFHGSASFQGFR